MWKLKEEGFGWKIGKCPCCGKGKFKFTPNGSISVNCESKGEVDIDDFYVPFRVCDNPLCEWSKIRSIIEERMG